MAEPVIEISKRLRQARGGTELTATEPSSIFALKSLLHPVVAFGTLLAIVFLRGESLYGPNFLLAVLTFLAAAHFLDTVRLQAAPRHFLALLPALDILSRWALVVTFIWALLHLSRLSDRYDTALLAAWAFTTPVALWIGQGAVQKYLNHARESGVGVRKAVIIGLTERGLRLEEQLALDPSLRVRVEGYFEERQADRLPSQGVGRILGRPSDLLEFIRRNDISVAYVTLPIARGSRVLRMLEPLRDSTVSIYLVPNLSPFELFGARFDVIGGIPVVALCESPFVGASSIAKRVSDLIIASLIVIAASPVLLAIAIGVRLSSPGPALFKQRRYGLDGQQIWVHKFRSMTVTEDGDKNYKQVTANDARVTRFGAFIRKYSLDELPQLFNVLGGTLSLVGPRPHAIAVNEQYRKLISGYMLRHKVKPGLTGWAQVNGYRGGDDLESMRKRVEYDMEYLRNWSFALDLLIIFRTAMIFWRDNKAY